MPYAELLVSEESEEQSVGSGRRNWALLIVLAFCTAVWVAIIALIVTLT